MADQVKTGQTSPELVEAESSTAPATIKKVELDLDDAPFLQAREEAPPPVPEEDLPVPESDEDKARRKKKRLIIAAICAAILVVAAIAVWWFFLRVPPPPPPEAPQPDVVVVPSTSAPTQPTDLVREFAPFVVPVREANGQTAFLVCKFSAITKDEAVNQEMTNRLIPLRDAIYYYLRGKDSSFLLDARNGADIKKDLVSIFNDYLTQGKLEDIVFESYLNR